MEQRPATVGVSYLIPPDLDRFLEKFEDRVMGIAAFGETTPFLTVGNLPFVHVPMATLEADRIYEVWTSDRPVFHERDGSIASARSDQVLFGCLQGFENGPGLHDVTRRAYTEIFDFLEGTGYNKLLRIWNYFPRITDVEDNEERYRKFNSGRHEAFFSMVRYRELIPAASALGSLTGPLTIYFLAAREAGLPVENPRQVSAYRYPSQYGTRSPFFSRAMRTNLGGSPLLLISGTSSIVGHESAHSRDPEAQTRETITNIRALLANGESLGFKPAQRGLTLKAYIRHREHYSLIRRTVVEEFGSGTKVVYLQADICRPELLVEIEGLCPSA